jgi:hypothetical protein
MNSLKRFLTPMLSDHQTRPFSQGGISVDPSPRKANANQESDESDAILDHSFFFDLFCF